MSSASCHDVLIAGAGLVGAALALALGRAGIDTVLVDDRAADPPLSPANANDWDARIYAISPSSLRFLAGIDAWRRVPAGRVASCQRMEVHGDARSSIVFDAWESGVDALACMAESREIERALQSALIDVGTVRHHRGDRIRALRSDGTAIVATLASGNELVARLVVGADGAKSLVRDLAGITSRRHDYHELGVVANFQCEIPHHDTAFQWFRADGVLAFLPLPDRRISIVWSTANDHARTLLGLAPEHLAEAVRDAAGGRLGNLELITSAQAFPLARVSVDSLIGHRVALVGDAAHVVHPLAGQGVNLGFGDVEALADILAGREPMLDPGDDRLLRRYRRHRAEPVQAMSLVMHGLHELFAGQGGIVRYIRNAGLNLTARAPVLPSLLARHAMG